MLIKQNSESISAVLQYQNFFFCSRFTNSNGFVTLLNIRINNTTQDMHQDLKEGIQNTLKYQNRVFNLYLNFFHQSDPNIVEYPGETKFCYSEDT